MKMLIGIIGFVLFCIWVLVRSMNNKNKRYMIKNLPALAHDREERVNELYNEGWDLFCIVYKSVRKYLVSGYEFQGHFKRRA